MKAKKAFGILFALAIVAATSACGGNKADLLKQGFVSPPDSARPWVYWMWMDGNLSREGITADLEAMKQAGIGGVVICEVNVGVPRGPVEFMSPEWRKLFKHVVLEAERLGLEITLNAGPGWTGSGGPWVKPEESMQHIVAAAVEVAGPRRFEDVLPRPQRRPAFFGDGILPAELEKAKNEYYQDVAVLAFPTPAAGPMISDIDEKALYVRAPYSSQEGVKPFLPAPANYPALPAGAAIDPARVIDLADCLSANGRFAWDVPEGRWTVLRFGRTTNGANTRPAPVPGLGLECDKLDKTALDHHFDAFIGALLREIGPRKTLPGPGWIYLHIDSWEMGAQNWTGAFREEFRKRRGYDLLPYLPTIAGRVVESPEISERFLWDLRLTAQELVVENHAVHLKEIGRRNGFGLSIEPYDMTPCADLTLGTVADVPMGEFWLYGFNTAHSVIEAASVAHTCGRRIVAAESFTSADIEAWRAYPASMKALGDWALAAGINRIVFHRYQHQPMSGVKPGMTMGPYGVHWERTQTWWDMVPAYHAYLARCHYLLRQGLPVADVCYLAAEGAPHVFRAPSSALRGSPPDRLGYNFDGIAPETLMANLSVKDGRLVLPDGMSYRVLVLPERETMTPALLNKVKELVEAGATVIGHRPKKSPSLSGYPGCDKEVERLADELWGNHAGGTASIMGKIRRDVDGRRIVERPYGKGRVVWEEKSDEVLKEAASEGRTSGAVPPEDRAPQNEDQNRSLRPDSGKPENPVWDVWNQPLNVPEQYGDFSVVARLLGGMGLPHDFESDAVLRYTHRREGETDIYFVANAEDRAEAATCVFRVSGRQPELWDAVTGETGGLDDFEMAEGCTSVPIRFEPYQSFFIVFRKPAKNPDPAGTRQNFPGIEKASEIGGPWEVAFDPKWGGPEKIMFEALDDWSCRPEVGVKYYSGIATYRKTFDLPPSDRQCRRGDNVEMKNLPSDEKNINNSDSDSKFDSNNAAGYEPTSGERGKSRLWLDLGAVMNIARVRLNGRDLGVVWCSPWRVDITGAVKQRDNRLEIDIANLWPNRLIGDEQQPPDCEYEKGGNLARWPDWLLRGEPRPSPGRFTFTTWKHYNKDSPLLPSGLLGPVTIHISVEAR